MVILPFVPQISTTHWCTIRWRVIIIVVFIITIMKRTERIVFLFGPKQETIYRIQCGYLSNCLRVNRMWTERNNNNNSNRAKRVVLPLSLLGSSLRCCRPIYQQWLWISSCVVRQIHLILVVAANFCILA